MSTGDKTKHIFLSYRSLEADFALQLATDLKNRGVSLWMDRLDIAPGDDWLKMLQQAVNNSVAMISVISPEYVASKYCQRELARADRLGRHILPVLLAPVAESDWPIEVERQQYIDFTQWPDEQFYQTQLNRLVNIVTERFADQTNLTPNPETQYINRLIADLEAQRGVIERLQPFLNAAQETQEVRPQPVSAKIWYMPGRFVLESEADGQPTPSGAARRAFDSIHAVTATYPRFVLVGGPGAGKTAVIHYLVLSAAHAYRAAPHVAPLPLLLKLTAWEKEPTPEAFVRAQWPLDSDPIKLLAKGKVSLYLEGLGELDQDHKINLLRQWLTGPNAPQRVIVTCRDTDYRDSIRLGFPIIQTLDLSAANIQEFVTHYLDEDESRRFLEQVLPTAENRAKVHYQYQMARNPFLLSAMIAVYLRARDRKLPQNMGVLLRRLVAELWNARQKSATKEDVPFEVVEAALADLAFTMIDDDLPIYVGQDVVMRYASSPAVVQAAAAANLLKAAGDKLRFSHQMLQDYFAALSLTRVGLPTRLMRPQFNAKVQRIPTRWDNAIILLTSIAPNPDAAVSSVAEVDPFLALRCALNAVVISDRTYKQITRQILETPGDQRIALARVFMGLDDEKAMLILLEVMRDAAWPIRQFAAAVLADIELPLLTGLAQAIEDLEDRTRETTLAALRQLGKNALPTLVRLLRSDNWHRRRGAVWALGELRDKAAVPLLVETLTDSDHLVSADAAEALGNIRDADAIPALLEALGHQNGRVGQATAKALANMGRQALPSLLKILDGKISHPQRQVYAIDALARLNDPAAAAALIDASYMENVEVRGAAVEGLRNFQGETVVRRLVECLSDTAKPRGSKQRICDTAAEILDALNGVEGKAAVEQWRKGDHQTAPRSSGALSSKKAKERLERVKEAAVPLAGSLATGLKDADWVVRRNTVLELGTVAAEAAVPRLADMLRDDDSQVRLAAVTTLAQFHDKPQIIPILVNALNDDEYVVCDAAKEALKAVARPPLPALTDILRGSNVNMRGAAIEILGSIRDVTAVPDILECLADLRRPWLSDDRICDIAARALEMIGTPEAVEGVRQWRALTEPTPEPAPPPSPPNDDALTQLLNQLQSSDWGVRQKAARSLNEYAQTLRGVADASVIQRLIDALGDPDWVVRFAMAEALGWFRDIISVPALIERVKDPKWKVRVAAVRSLAEIGDLDAVEPAIIALSDEHNLVREAAAEALGNLGDVRAVDSLMAALDDEERFVRLAAIDALGKIREPGTINALVSQLNQDDDAVRCFAVYALARIGLKPVVSGLIASLEDTAVPYWEDRRICDIAAEALEMIATPEARTAVWEWRRRQAQPATDT